MTTGATAEQKPDGWIVKGTILKSAHPMLFLATEPDAEKIVRGFAEDMYEGQHTNVVTPFFFGDKLDDLRVTVVDLLEILRQWEPDNASDGNRQRIIQAMYQVGILKPLPVDLGMPTITDGLH